MSITGKMLVPVALALTLTSCASAEATEGRTYSAKLYNGGNVVEEWHGISNYARWSDQYITFYIDGEQVNVMGGPLVIREES